MGQQSPDVELPTTRLVRSPIPPRRPVGGSVLALRNWRVTSRLIALIAIPTMMGLIFGGLRVGSAASAASGFGQVRQLALLGQQVTGLAQALEDERDLTAGYVAAGRPSAKSAQVQGQYRVTDGWAAQVQQMASGIGGSYPVQTQDKAAVVLARLADLPGLRAVAAVGAVPDTSPLITEYSATISELIAFNDEVAQDSANPALADTVRTLDALSRMKDDVSLQRGILYSALIERQFDLGTPQALATAQTQQASDQTAFQSSATAAQESLFDTTVATPAMDQNQVLESLMVDSGTTQVANATPAQWYTSMSGTIGRMRNVETQLAASVVAQSQVLQQGAQRSAVLTGILSLVLLLTVLIATFIVARSMVRPLRTLRSDALEIASVRLPQKVSEIGDAEDPPDSVDVTPVSVHSVDEIGQVARAFDQVHREAVRLAGNEAMLRSSMNAMFVSLSRRSQSLLERLVRLIDSLEQSEDDPGRLSNLFTMDHLVTRMRRHSENLLVLAGHEPARKRAEPLALTDMVRAAASEIQQYNRVVLNVQPGLAVVGQSVNDIVHLLAEIIENATLFSSNDSQVHVSGHSLESGGILIEVTDSGIGVPAERLAQLNWRLDNPPLADVSVSRHMGLFAVSHLAARHGVRVRLRQAAPRGLTALVWIPESLITTETDGTMGWPGGQFTETAKPAAGAGGWSAFGRHRSSRKTAAATAASTASAMAASATAPSATGTSGTRQEQETAPVAAVPPGAATAEEGRPPWSPGASGPVPIFESMASEWFRRGVTPRPAEQSPEPAGAPDRAGWSSPADAGWRAAESAAMPVRGHVTAAGLPQRIPRANMVPGSVGERPVPVSGSPVPARPAGPAGQPRSAENARNRLAGFQRGTRRAQTSGSRPDRPTGA